MGFTMRAAVPLKLMTHIIRESSATEDCRFVHIIPKARHPIIDKSFVQGSPPGTDLGVGEVRKLTATRPYKSFHKIIIPPSAEIIVFLALLKYPILIVDLDSRINHHDSLEAISRQISDHLLRIRKVTLIPSETTVAVHIINIQIDGITRDFPFPKFRCYIPNFCFRIVAPTALMVANTP